MRLATIEAVVATLNNAEVRYLVTGGLAVNAHGYLRLTMVIDLVIALDPDNVKPAFAALAEIGYQPNVPVTAEQFADANTRQIWIEEKGMRVLNFFSDDHPETSVDIFVDMPFDFDKEWEQAIRAAVTPGVRASFASLPTLIEMKEAVGRPRDLDDVQHLRWILEDQGNGK